MPRPRYARNASVRKQTLFQSYPTIPRALLDEDALTDRGSTFLLKWFVNDGIPQAKVVAMPILFRRNAFFSMRGLWDY